MRKNRSFTEGPILSTLLRFAVPVLGAMILQAMYGAVDLLVVGHFADAAAVSAVSTGSQLMHTLTTVIIGLAMGVTVLVGRSIGEGRPEKAGEIIGSSIWLFGALGAVMSLLVAFLARPLTALMHAPEKAFEQTVRYVAICGAGTLFITAYNVLGSVFRGVGDSKTPLIVVAIACVCNILGDLLFVAVIPMAAAGAALATVLAQGISVALCILLLRKKQLPFPFSRRCLKPRSSHILQTMKVGAPIALQDLLVSLSFLVLMVIINSIGLTASAGMGVAEKLCAFIMLVPSAFSSSLSAFVAQNIGANQPVRARRAMLCGMLASLSVALIISWLSFFHGEMLASIFSRDGEVNLAAADYLKGYAIDVLLTSFLFCFIGYFNGCGNTTFVMLQGLIGAFGVRIPVSWAMSRIQPPSLFRISLATPASTLVQILLFTAFLWWTVRKEKRGGTRGGTRGKRGSAPHPA